MIFVIIITNKTIKIDSILKTKIGIAKTAMPTMIFAKLHEDVSEAAAAASVYEYFGFIACIFITNLLFAFDELYRD
jgi:hypothetical protein